MVVDDEPDTVELVRHILEAEGYEVVGVSGGKECLERLESEAPDLILLDVMMPEMDGWEVFKRVRETHDVPIAMLTVRSQGIDRLLGLHVLKADDYIIKPFTKQDLVTRVREILERPGSTS
ncbi:MAG: response regulator [Euryarchaeota archaeon]|nr:response regulator [Euryarchaeota archaeon]